MLRETFAATVSSQGAGNRRGHAVYSDALSQTGTHLVPDNPGPSRRKAQAPDGKEAEIKNE